MPSHDWYYSFMVRNYEIVDIRPQTSLEASRAKLNKEEFDRWYICIGFGNFLSSKDLLDKPGQTRKADETCFVLGSKAGKVSWPSYKATPVPHITSSKDRPTAMFCASAEENMISAVFDIS